jgi:hypothetical protein
MLGQAIPVGITIGSPITWFVIVVAVVVLALTLTTRRANIRPAGGAPRLPAGGTRADYAAQWSSAQTCFVDDPRAGCERAQAIVAGIMRERGIALDPADRRVRRFRAGCSIVERADASTDELRTAFIEFRTAFGLLMSDVPAAERQA